MPIQESTWHLQSHLWAMLAVIWCHAALADVHSAGSSGQCTSLLQVDTRPGRKPTQINGAQSDHVGASMGADGKTKSTSHQGLATAQTSLSLAAAHVSAGGSQPAAYADKDTVPQEATSQVAEAAGISAKLRMQFSQLASQILQRRTGSVDTFTIVALVIVLFLSILLGLFLAFHHRQQSMPEQKVPLRQTQEDRPRQSPPASQRSHQAAAPSPPSPYPPDQSTRPPDRRVLCKELVVPEGTECVLAVPVTGLETSQRTQRNFAVTDKKGKTLLSVNLVLPKGPSGHRIERLTLQSAGGGDALASCDIVIPTVGSGAGGPRISCTIQSKDDNLFARMKFELHDAPKAAEGETQLGQCYEMVGVGGTWTVSFYGDLSNHNLNVTNDKSQLLGTVEAANLPFGEPGSHYQLRVAPLADAGLILMALLALDRMKCASIGR